MHPQKRQVIVQHVHHHHEKPGRSGSVDAAAMIASLFVPGLGHMVKGQVLNGMCWFVVVLLGYALLIIPGLVLHVICIIGATRAKSA